MESYSAQIRRIREAFPELALSSLRADPDGLINDVLILNEELVFRFPKNDTWARELLRNEIRVIDLLSDYTNMHLPVFEHRFDDFVAYKFIPGTALQRNDILTLDDTAQDRIAEQLADFLRQMHTIPMVEIIRHNISQSDVNRSHNVWRRLAEDVERVLFPLMMAHTRQWVVRHFEPILKDEHWMEYQAALINGDVSPYHILHDGKGTKINGIIDFGTAGIGDPAADFACIIYHYGETFLQRMAKFYPEIREGVDRARFWAGTLELQWALRAIASENKIWFTVHIGGARDVLPVGSRWT